MRFVVKLNPHNQNHRYWAIDWGIGSGICHYGEHEIDSRE